MNISIKDIIGFLPFDKKIKMELLEKFDTYDAERKLAISDLLWQTYDELFESKFQENMRKAIEEVSDGTKPITSDFRKKIEDQTQKEIEDDMLKNTTEYNLSAVRSKLKQILEEPQEEKKF